MEENNNTASPDKNIDENIQDATNPFKEELEEKSKEENETSSDKNPENETDTKKESDEFENIEDTESKYKKQYEDLESKYIRLAADFDNFRKRTLQEKEDLSKFACADLLKTLTTVLDTFDRAKEHLKGIDNCQTIKESYELAFKQLVETLKKAGLEEIDALEKPFDPNEHEAVAQVESKDLEPNTVAFVAQKGYKLNNKVLRPALVGVTTEKENKDNE